MNEKIRCSITNRHIRQAMDAMNAAMAAPRDNRARAKATAIAGLALLSGGPRELDKLLLLDALDNMRAVLAGHQDE